MQDPYDWVQIGLWRGELEWKRDRLDDWSPSDAQCLRMLESFDSPCLPVPRILPAPSQTGTDERTALMDSIWGITPNYRPTSMVPQMVYGGTGCAQYYPERYHTLATSPIETQTSNF